jgi:hypothetical protein
VLFQFLLADLGIFLVLLPSRLRCLPYIIATRNAHHQPTLWDPLFKGAPTEAEESMFSLEKNNL